MHIFSTHEVQTHTHAHTHNGSNGAAGIYECSALKCYIYTIHIYVRVHVRFSACIFWRGSENSPPSAPCGGASERTMRVMCARLRVRALSASCGACARRLCTHEVYACTLCRATHASTHSHMSARASDARTVAKQNATVPQVHTIIASGATSRTNGICIYLYNNKSDAA